MNQHAGRIPPLLDIIIPVHDNAGWLDLCVRAVEHNTRNSYRVIVVDGASREQKTHQVLADLESRGHTVVRLAENRSFSNAINAGVLAGSGKYVVILNDDAIVTEGWDSAILQDLSNKYTGLVGARSNYASGAQGDPSFVGEPPYLVFVCVGIRREVWDVVGPLDEVTFDGFSTEDIDYSWRVKKAGYNLKVSAAYVLHAGSQTLAATMGGALELQRNNQKYNQRLVDKWGKDWAADHSKLKQNVLVVSFHSEEWTRVSFLGAFIGLKRSDGVSFQFYNHVRAPIHHARLAIADFATDGGFDIVCMLDDDAVFQSDILKTLLKHQKDVVTALAYQRKKPHGACIFELGPDGLMGGHLEGWEDTGLRRVDVSGLHCAVIHTSVFKKLREAGIRQYFGGFDNKLGEDFAFCVNLKKIGVQVHCDTDVNVGHIGEAIVVDKKYKAEFTQRQQHALAVTAAV
jgi:GT2 family glycosyltransferase